MLRTLSLTAITAAALSLPAGASTLPVDFPSLSFPSGGQATTVSTSNCAANSACSITLPAE